MCQELWPIVWEKSHSHFVVIAALLPRSQILTSWDFLTRKSHHFSVKKNRLYWSSSRILCWTHLAQVLSNESYIKNCHGTFESTLKSPPMLYFIGVTSCCCTFSIPTPIEVAIEFKNLQLFFSGVIHILHGSPLQWNFLI
jgi:hypothetical protein